MLPEKSFDGCYMLPENTLAAVCNQAGNMALAGMRAKHNTTNSVASYFVRVCH